MNIPHWKKVVVLCAVALIAGCKAVPKLENDTVEYKIGRAHV